MLHINDFILEEFTKYLVFYFCAYFIFIKIIEYKDNTLWKTSITLVSSIFVAILFVYLKIHVSYLYSYIITYLIYSAFIKFIIKKKYLYCILITLISLIVVYIFFFVASLIIAPISYILIEEAFPLYVSLIIDFCAMCLVCLFLNIKKIENGFNFLKNENKLENVTGLVSIAVFIVMCTYSLKTIVNVDQSSSLTSNNNDLSKTILYIVIGILGIAIFLWIKNNLLNHYIKTMNKKTIDTLSESLNYKDKEIADLNKENFFLSKKNHSMNHDLNVLKFGFTKLWSSPNISQKLKEELRAENGEFISLMEKISSEGNDGPNKLRLNKTDIPELDLALEYLQQEAYKQNINFILKLKGSIRYMTEKLISEERLIELLKDHIKDAIIAVKASDNSFRSIMVIIGEINKYYGIRIFDSGIEFEIETLIDLGLKPTTTHESEGGTGFGFINTFDTLNITNASLVIEEMKVIKTNYTKIINIIFDNKKEYRIHSYRADLIRKQNKENRIKIEKPH